MEVADKNFEEVVAQTKIAHAALRADLTKIAREYYQMEVRFDRLKEHAEELIMRVKNPFMRLDRFECLIDIRNPNIQKMDTKVFLGNLPLGEVIAEFIPVGDKYEHIDEIAYSNSKEEILEYLEDFPLQEEVYKFLKENLQELPEIESLFYGIRNYQKVPGYPPYTDFDRIKELANSFWTRKVMSHRKETFLSVLKVLEKMILYLGLKKLQKNHVLFNIRYFPTGNGIKN